MKLRGLEVTPCDSVMKLRGAGPDDGSGADGVMAEFDDDATAMAAFDDDRMVDVDAEFITIPGSFDDDEDAGTDTMVVVFLGGEVNLGDCRTESLPTPCSSLSSFRNPSSLSSSSSPDVASNGLKFGIA